MNTLRKEFCDETNTPMGLDNEFDYIRWLEAKIQALRIHAVVGLSEQLKCGNQNPPCAPNLKFGMIECCECSWSE